MSIGLRPSQFAASTGLIDDIDVIITRARFVLYDYEGKADKDALVLRVDMKDGDGGEHVQYYSAGDTVYFVPSEDPKHPDESGKELVKVGEKDAINSGCNFAIFMSSFVNAGFDEGSLDSGDISVIEGQSVHVNQVPAPKRGNLPKRPGQSDREKTILIVTRINEPQSPKAGATPPGAKAKPATQSKAAPAAKGPAVDEDLAAELTGEMIGLFASKDVAELKKVELVKGLFATIDKSNGNKQKLIAAAGKEEYLKALEGFEFDGSVLKMA